MTEKCLIISISSIFAFSPVYVFASSASLASSLSLNYVQSVVVNGSNYVKLAFNQVVASANGSLASVGQYVSYIRPTASMIARVVLPRLLLAASGIGTIALVGWGIYELWQYMKSKGYSFDSDSNSITYGNSQKTATVEEVNKLTGDFLNSDHYYAGGFSLSLDSQQFTGVSAQTVCTQYMNAFKQKGNYVNVSSCTFTGATCGTNNTVQKGFLFKATYSTDGTNSLNTQGCVIAYTSVNTYPPKVEEKPKSISASSIANHIADSIALPEVSPSFIDDFKVANPSAYDSVLQSVFNPAYPEAIQNIEQAKSDARPAYAGEVAQTIPENAISGTDVIATPIPNVTTKNPDGSVAQELPSFCTWAPSLCKLADYLTATTNPSKDEVPEIKPEITVQDRLTVNAICPPAKSINIFLGRFDIDYALICEFANIVRPFVLIMGYLFSAFIVIRKF